MSQTGNARSPTADLAGVVEVPPASGDLHPEGGAHPAPRHPLRLLLLLGALSALGPASMDIYVPGLPSLASDLGASASATQLTVASFLVGLGVGQLVAGPLSDVHGRRGPLLGTIVAFLAATAVCAVAPDVTTLTLGRLLQGGAAAGGIVIARAVVRDVYAGAAGARALSRLVLVYGLAPVIAPLIGGQVLAFTSWRGLFAVLFGMGLAMLALAAIALPETLPAERRRPRAQRATWRALRVLVRDRPFVGYALALGCSMGALVAYLAGSPFVLQDTYGLSAQQFALVFGAIAATMVAASQVNAHVVGRVGPRPMLVGAVLAVVVAGAAMVGSASAGLGLWALLPCMFVVMCSWGLIPANAIALAMAGHREIAGSASAILGVVQYGLSAVAAPLVGIGGEASAITMGVVVLALGLLSAVAIATLSRSRRPAPA